MLMYQQRSGPLVHTAREVLHTRRKRLVHHFVEVEVVLQQNTKDFLGQVSL